MVLIRFSIQISIYLMFFSSGFNYFLVYYLSQECRKFVPTGGLCDVCLLFMFYMCKFCKYLAQLKKVFIFTELVFCVIDLIETTLYYSTCTFSSLFQVCLDRTLISCHTFCERLKFEVFKIKKTALKSLNGEK